MKQGLLVVFDGWEVWYNDYARILTRGGVENWIGV